jgi:hypothetical protein
MTVHPLVHSRFRPPHAEIDATIGWVLARSFGPTDAELSPPPDSAGAVARARQFDLAARIGARTPVEILQRDLGAKGARELLVASAVVGAINARLLALARQIATLAEAVHAPVAFLKGIALLASGTVRDNARALSDVDVLVRDGDAPALIESLRERGFISADSPPTEYHLPPLTRSINETIEVHVRVPAVRAAPDGPWVGLDDLLSLGQLGALPGWPATTHAPSAEFLRAHALAHGLAQHGLAPDTYPMTRMFCDLVDLGPGGGTPTPSPEHALGLAIDVCPGEVSAVLALCHSLRAGAAAGIDPVGAHPEQRALLHHLVLAPSDERYRAALRLRAPLNSLTELSLARHWWREITQTAFPSRGQLAVIYGPRRTSLGYALLRLWRPFDLALRTLRYSCQALQSRARGRPISWR